MTKVPADVLTAAFSETLSYIYPVQPLPKFLANEMEIKKKMFVVLSTRVFRSFIKQQYVTNIDSVISKWGATKTKA